MQKKKRWVDGVLKEAGKSDIILPWARGNRRAIMITRRRTDAEAIKQKIARAH